MTRNDLFLRLAQQHCLAEEDIVAISTLVNEFSTSNISCSMILRRSSPDGISNWSPPVVIRKHAGVPDVFITEEGTHIVVFNDMTPGLFEETLRTDPEGFWRQGLIGLGGLGMVADTRGVFEDVPDIDLHLEMLQLVVDPDIGQGIDHNYHLSYFGIPPETLAEGDWDPMQSALPHHFYLSPASDWTHWPTATLALASSYEQQGGADPSILDLQDGRRLLYIGGPSEQMPAWISADGLQWDPSKNADIINDFGATTPDVVADPQGGYRLYYLDHLGNGLVMRQGEDGQSWNAPTKVVIDTPAGGPSVAVDPTGTWWLYFTMYDTDCGA